MQDQVLQDQDKSAVEKNHTSWIILGLACQTHNYQVKTSLVTWCETYAHQKNLQIDLQFLKAEKT